MKYLENTLSNEKRTPFHTNLMHLIWFSRSVAFILIRLIKLTD